MYILSNLMKLKTKMLTAAKRSVQIVKDFSLFGGVTLKLILKWGQEM